MWKAGLWQRKVAPRLSQQMVGLFGMEKSSSLRRLTIQIVSSVALTMALYSASLEERATVCYFLDDQLIGEPPCKTTCAPVEHRLSGLPPQSESE